MSEQPFRRKIIHALAWAVCLAALVVAGLLAMSERHDRPPSKVADAPPVRPGVQKATFGSGCFWCTEAVFERLEGVHTVVSGYSGGHLKDPTYEQVCSGTSGHAEVVQVSYDPSVITYRELLEVFWRTHDPTTPNRQGPDVGTQYRSAIFCHDDEQQKQAEEYRGELEKSGAFDDPIVTEIAALDVFYPAEAYHQNYYARNPDQSYCTMIIAPKMNKFSQVFKDKLKTSTPFGP